jgi:hypothetical protein
MERPFTHPRWGPGSLQPVEVSSPPGYSPTAKGTVRRAELRDQAGQLLGHVWTDDDAAAGFLPAESAGSAGARAASYVWVVLSQCAARDIPASELLDPALYEPDFVLDA